MASKSDFNQRTLHFTPKDYLPADKGISVQDTLRLIEHCSFKDKLLALLDVEAIQEDFIAIAGASMLVNAVDVEGNRFLKVDVTSDYLDLAFTDNTVDKSVNITFNDLSAVTFPNNDFDNHAHVLEEGIISAVPVYAAKSTFFSELHSLSNYANDLLKSQHGFLVLKNLEWLREIFKKEEDRLVRKYRLLKDGETYFLRGIVSPRYVDYNLAVSVFIALIALHKNSKQTGDRYLISLCEYSESHLRVFFAKEGTKQIGTACRVKHMIQLSNDELKREALKFTGVASIQYQSGQETREIYLAPRDIGFSIASIFHSYSPKRAIERLELANNITQIEQKLYDDIAFINDIKQPDQIRHLLQRRINEDTNIKPFITGEIAQELDNDITTIHQLFDIMYKLDVVVADIDAKEYLRYLLYNLLKEEKTRRDNEKNKSKGKK
jgi:hypothetical protein